MEGWVKLHRCLLDKAIWKCSTPEQKTVLITLLMLANHEKNQWEWNSKQYECEPGQLVTSLSSLAEISGVSVRNVRTALAKFKNYGFLTNDSTKTGRLITIENWAFYQGQVSETDKATDKRVTKTRQRPDKDLTTNKNDKNDKNEKKLIQYGDDVFMTAEDYQKLVTKHGEFAAKRMVEILDNFKGSSGKQYKSDFKAILTWVVKRYEEEKRNPPPTNAPVQAKVVFR